MEEPILILENIHKKFDETGVLKGIDLTVNRGEFVTLLGSSGCGKTTTLRIIAGLEQPDEGRVILSGEDVTQKEPNCRDVNTIFQNYALFPHMNVRDNVGYGLKLLKRPKAEIAKRVSEALEMVQMDGFETRRVTELSGGQKQRVAIARALVKRPHVLLLDEPLGALDLQLRRQMQLELKRLQKKLGITFIYITHDQEEAINMSDRIVVMNEGVFEQVGTPDEIYNQPRTGYVAGFVGNANLIVGTLERVEGTLAHISIAGTSMQVQIREEQTGRYRVGAEVSVAVRSESIELRTKTKEAPGGIGAVVTEKSFAGGLLRLQLKLEDGQEVVASRHGINCSFENGEQILIGFMPELAVLVE